MIKEESVTPKLGEIKLNPPYSPSHPITGPYISKELKHSKTLSILEILDGLKGYEIDQILEEVKTQISYIPLSFRREILE